MTKIAIMGVAGGGKGEVAKILTELNPELRKYALADPIKTFLRHLLNLEDSHLYGDLKEVPNTFRITVDSYNKAAEYYMNAGIEDFVAFSSMWGRFLDVFAPNLVGIGTHKEWTMHSISPRRLQQLFGTEVVRHYDDKVWTKMALAQGDNIVIDDLRFVLEAKMLQAKGFHIVHVVGGNSRITNTQELNHSSEKERALIRPDITIDNRFDVFNSKTRSILERRVRDTLKCIEQLNVLKQAM